jgi:hypothetical protein
MFIVTGETGDVLHAGNPASTGKPLVLIQLLQMLPRRHHHSRRCSGGFSSRFENLISHLEIPFSRRKLKKMKLPVQAVA